ncbi:hypothetical protein N7462_006649 [Penicillium macrosclerotiorum]|uniref:uncharacterized protein n=1 Tax=Penicillium macrosclerotiorum TaxID=303699 RepID=UPI002547BF1C|nr:uncharacterized protein N7462_006649 [Penicillium macrosclerotiorum]KAJ5683484.1 hypothetical protein N7462_006649 [Penicillium macrosclerotiorum]
MLTGKGLRAVAVMWAMTFISFILVPLRLYTRIYIIKALGLDDHVFNLAWVFLLLYTVFVTVAGVYGFGQSITSLEMDSAVNAVYYEMIGQTFAVLGMAIAKLSLGIFLLRIVVKQWHRISIWISMVSLSVVSVMTAILFWVQRLPSESIYDPRVPGRTVVGITPFSILLGSWCAAVDFYFALLPWIFIWKLNMKFKEKMSIAISLSLGFVACVCGIIRTIELGGLASTNYTEDTVSLIIWSAVELAVTLICVGIPTVRPLYRVIVHGSNLESSENGYVKQSDSNHSYRFRMRNIAKDATLFSVNEGNTESHVTRDNRSDEEVLVGQHGNKNNNGIRVRDEVRVERI